MAPPDAEIEVLAERELEPVLADHARSGAITDATTEVVSNNPLATSDLVDAARDRTRSVAHRLRTHARRHQGAPNPRHNSVVRRLVWEDAGTLVERFQQLPLAAPSHDSEALRFAGSQLLVDPDHQDYRVAASLRVARTIGAHPVWLWVEPWWGTRSVIGVELRSTHRPHYTRRYFDAAHDALRQLVELVGAPISPRSIQPPRRPRRPDQLPRSSSRAQTALGRSITHRFGK